MFRNDVIAIVIILISFLRPALGQQEQPRPVQFRGFITGTLGILDNLGYTNPKLGFGGGLEMESRQLLTTSEMHIAVDHKIETGDGHSYGFEAVSYKKFDKFLIGAGTRFSKLMTSQWSKGGWEPFGGIGYDGEDYRIQVKYIIPTYDVQNRLSGVMAGYQYRPGGHWAMEYVFGFYRFQDTRVPGVYYAQRAEKHTAGSTDFVLKYYF